MLARVAFVVLSAALQMRGCHGATTLGQRRQHPPPTTVTVTSSIAPIGAMCRALKLPNCPSGIVEETFFGLTADSSSFLVQDAPSGRWDLLGSKPLHATLSAISPITIRVGGTFTDVTSMPGPRPGISKHEPNQYNFSAVGWAAMNHLVQRLPGSQLVVSLNGLLRHWDQKDIPWDPTNAKAFIADNIAQGYEIYGYELGNEPGCWGSHGGNVPAQIHAQDFGVLQGLLADAYPDVSTRPLVLGPDTTGCGGANSSGDLREILQGEPAWNVTTVHLYSVQPNANASVFLKAAQENTMCTRAVTQLGWLKASKLNGTRLWNGEGGESYLTTGGGGYLHQFGGALSLMNNLGCLPTVLADLPHCWYFLSVLDCDALSVILHGWCGCMQVGVERLLKHDLFENMFVMFHGNSANTTARIQPYPPYWSAWLFKQLVGTASVRMCTSALSSGRAVLTIRGTLCSCR